MHLISDYRQREKWFRRNLRAEKEVLSSPLTIDELSQRMNDALTPTGMRQKSLHGRDYVTGRLIRTDPVSFRFTGYRDRSRLPVFFDPNKILKPQLVGTLNYQNGETIISYSIDARVPTRRFYILLLLALILFLLSATFAITVGFNVQSPAFLLLVATGVCYVFAKQTWDAVPSAMLDAAFLEEWLTHSLQ